MGVELGVPFETVDVALEDNPRKSSVSELTMLLSSWAITWTLSLWCELWYSRCRDIYNSLFISWWNRIKFIFDFISHSGIHLSWALCYTWWQFHICMIIQNLNLHRSYDRSDLSLKDFLGSEQLWSSWHLAFSVCLAGKTSNSIDPNTANSSISSYSSRICTHPALLQWLPQWAAWDLMMEAHSLPSNCK